jgi:regulator of cell morphogenesis and NO signaling
MVTENSKAAEVNEIIDYIITTYHRPLRRNLTALVALAGKVESVHAEKADCPAGLADHLEKLHASVLNHLEKEEQILFPLIQSGGGPSAYMPIKVMMQEHEDLGGGLRRTRAITGNLEAPSEACASWRELYKGLANLEAEICKHAHLENYVLFPRALKVDEGEN